MKFLSERISVSEKPQATSIIITPERVEAKQTLLFTWLVFWTIGGIIVFSQLFYDYNKDTKLFLLVWLFFWAYFEYVMVGAYFWRKYGFERIIIKNGKLNYKKDIKGRGKTKNFDIEFVRNIEMIDHSDSSFFKNLSRSYWVVGGETIKFDYHSKTISIGMQLEQEEAGKLMKLIKSKL